MNHNILDILYFTSRTCGVCHALKPKVEALIRNEFPQLVFKEIKIEVQPDIAGQFLVLTAPALLLVNGNQELYRIAGPMGLQQIKDGLSKALRTE